MRTALLWPFVILFMLASAGSGMLFKLAADSSGRTALWYFVVGNVVGFLCPVALTFGLKHGNPNAVYAFCYGGAFALLQVASSWMFKQPLSLLQWTGIVAVGAGIFLLQIRGG